MNTFKLRVISAEGRFFDGECESLVFPTLDGRTGILADHCNMLGAVTQGGRLEGGHVAEVVEDVAHRRLERPTGVQLASIAQVDQGLAVARALGHQLIAGPDRRHLNEVGLGGGPV